MNIKNDVTIFSLNIGTHRAIFAWFPNFVQALRSLFYKL